MQDRVADVLAERKSLESGGAAAVLVSLILHGSIAAAAVYAAVYRPSVTVVPALTIKFAKMPASRPLEVAKEPAAKEIPKIEAPRPQPVKPVETQSPEPPKKNAVPFSPFGRSSKPGADVVAPPVAPPRLEQSTTTGVIAAGEAGITALEGGDFPYTIYLERMKTLIGARWVRPTVTTSPTSVVYFRIERDGRIVDADHSLKSGNGLFDRAALSAVRAASPLPPLPFGYSGNYLGVHLTFR